jgi:hypothetical protein
MMAFKVLDGIANWAAIGFLAWRHYHNAKKIEANEQKISTVSKTLLTGSSEVSTLTQ